MLRDPFKFGALDAFAAQPLVISGEGYDITHQLEEPEWSAFYYQRNRPFTWLPIRMSEYQRSTVSYLKRDLTRRSHKQTMREARAAAVRQSHTELLELRRTYKLARKTTRRQLAKIQRLLDAGQSRKAREVQRAMLSSFHCKLMAFEKANNSLKRRYRLTAKQLIEEAAQLNLYEVETEIVRLRLEAKENTPARLAHMLRGKKHRLIQSFGIRHKARQYLCKMALEPFLLPELRRDQFGIQGSNRADAIALIIEAIESGRLRYFIELDIQNFFTNIGTGRDNALGARTYFLDDWLPLPKKVIQTSVLSKHNTVDLSRIPPH